jgi:hypothetical protein
VARIITSVVRTATRRVSACSACSASSSGEPGCGFRLKKDDGAMRNIRAAAIEGHNDEYDLWAAEPIMYSRGAGGNDINVCRDGEAVMAFVNALST